MAKRAVAMRVVTTNWISSSSPQLVDVMAQECAGERDGMTIWEDHFYPEIIDPGSSLPVTDGELGELVITTLTKEAMPVIRYRTRDLTRLLPGAGRTMRRIDRIRGRSDDMLIIRGVNVFPSQIEAVLA